MKISPEFLLGGASVHPFAGRFHLMYEVRPETFDNMIDGLGHLGDVVVDDKLAHVVQSFVAALMHEGVCVLFHFPRTQT
jgi:hypothetical protein